MILARCAICNSRKIKFIKRQEASGILSSVSNRKPLSKIPVLRDIFLNKIIVYKYNPKLLPKVWRKYKKHYSTDFKSYKRWNNSIIEMYCMWR